MDSDKVFAAYAFLLVTGVASAITASVLVGFAPLPSMGVFLSHLAMSLAFRGAYKSIGGFDWVYRAGEIAGMITSPSDVDVEISMGAEATS